MVKKLSIIYILTLLYACLTQFRLMVIVSAILPFLVPLLFKIFKINMLKEIQIINIIFIYFASLIGSSLGGYNLPVYDKIIHFISGIIVACIGYIVYKYYNKEENVLMIIFINAFNMLVAFLWEVYEYILLFFGYDAIRHYSSGVHDMIGDMIVCFIGGVLISLYIIKFKNHFLRRIQCQLLVDIKENM